VGGTSIRETNMTIEINEIDNIKSKLFNKVMKVDKVVWNDLRLKVWGYVWDNVGNNVWNECTHKFNTIDSWKVKYE
jgi:hypothetical protein